MEPMPRSRPVDVTTPAAADLLAAYFAERASTFPAGPAAYVTTLPDPAAFTPPAGVFVVVEDDDVTPGHTAPAPLGCGGVRAVAPGPDGVVRYEVKHLYVAPAGRGRGLGRDLLAELERRARDLGAGELVLDTNDSLAAAGGLYRSSGFERIEPYNANPNATAWYRKALDPAAPSG
jgi:ribosomal protein S18 acetylase RimI-like enzyme